jgi:hypothetical protein
VAWIVRAVKIGGEGEGPATDVMEINRPGGLADIVNLGLTLAETKRFMAGLQQEIVAAQVRDHACRRSPTALPVNTGTRSASGASLRPHDLPNGR